MAHKDYLIAIPCYQEEGRVGDVVRRALNHGPVLVVDDGSSDRTAEEAEKHGAHVIRHAANQGKGSAIQTVFHYFLKGKWQGLILLDGDGQHDPEEIPGFFEAAQPENIMMVVGNRMHQIENMPKIRILTNWFMSKLLSIFVGIEVPDSQCGFRYIKRGLIENIKLQAERFDIESELLIEASRFSKGVISVPIATIYGDERSKIRPVQDTLRFIKLMIKARRQKKK
jgi:glycosyltransferase involved in cell wall biosynthesis